MKSCDLSGHNMPNLPGEGFPPQTPPKNLEKEEWYVENVRQWKEYLKENGWCTCDECMELEPWKDKS